MAAGGFLTLHKDVDTSKFVDDSDRKMNGIHNGRRGDALRLTADLVKYICLPTVNRFFIDRSCLI